MSADRAIRFERFGGPEVLDLVEVDVPEVPPDGIRIRVLAAGLNPVDASLFSGAASSYRVTLPSGNGNDFAGVVDAVGSRVSGIGVGDRVFGGARFHAQADHVVTTADRVVPVPDGVPIEVAATLDIVGRTAVAAIDAVGVDAGDTVLVSGAAGGLGSLVVQLAAIRGTRVLGTGSAESAVRIAGLGATPVEYGDGLVDRIRALVPAGVDAVLDCGGHGTVAAGIALGVDPGRINTNADHAAIDRFGILNRGAHTDRSLEPLRGIAGLVAEGRIRVRIAAGYPLERVRDAYTDLRRGHTQGKIVLRLGERDPAAE